MHYGVGIIAWSPLMRGLLGGILAKQRDTGRSASEQTQGLLERHRDQVERYEAFCAKLGEHPSAVGLAWLLQQPGRDGADHRTAHAGAVRRAICTRSTCALDDDALAELDAIFPGPGTGTGGLGLVAVSPRRRRPAVSLRS